MPGGRRDGVTVGSGDNFAGEPDRSAGRLLMSRGSRYWLASSQGRDGVALSLLAGAATKHFPKPAPHTPSLLASSCRLDHLKRPPHLQPLKAVQDLVLGCGNVVVWILRQVAGPAAFVADEAVRSGRGWSRRAGPSGAHLRAGDVRGGGDFFWPMLDRLFGMCTNIHYLVWVAGVGAGERGRRSGVKSLRGEGDRWWNWC